MPASEWASWDWRKVQEILVGDVRRDGYTHINERGAASPQTLWDISSALVKVSTALTSSLTEIEKQRTALITSHKWTGDAATAFDTVLTQLRTMIRENNTLLTRPVRSYDDLILTSGNALNTAINAIIELNYQGARETKARYDSLYETWRNEVVYTEYGWYPDPPHQPWFTNGSGETVYTPSAYSDIDNSLSERARAILTTLATAYQDVTTSLTALKVTTTLPPPVTPNPNGPNTNTPPPNPPPPPNIPSPNIPGPNSPDLPGGNSPDLPGSNSPNIPGLNSPNLPGSNSPNVPGPNSPNLPGSNSPNLPGAIPNLPGSNSPSIPGTTRPTIPGSNSPGIPGSGVPGLPGSGSPGIPPVLPGGIPGRPSIPGSPSLPGSPGGLPGGGVRPGLPGAPALPDGTSPPVRSEFPSAGGSAAAQDVTLGRGGPGTGGLGSTSSLLAARGGGAGGAGGSGTGMPFMPMSPGAGGGKKDGEERERTTWLQEDRDIWGVTDDVAPGVIRGGDPGTADEPDYVVTPGAPVPVTPVPRPEQPTTAPAPRHATGR
ncbi:hypothetical protein Cs7R123_42760 [Catellatospora sp. TT07R-123]|uniref:WXG100 family type VII secretion target n=1 Tax=Catellatospora sp. TT07R-123 TaxID=2733863 RepID=UPI001B2F3280|nr:hypothetical protein [Catellatospora sp. TT07R-123]GHJ46934.1 hypothetical protein Cs7R123_42760 [Catellatospora sp. TT07R-123]